MTTRGISISHWPASRVVFVGFGAGVAAAVLLWLLALASAIFIARAKGFCP